MISLFCYIKLGGVLTIKGTKNLKAIPKLRIIKKIADAGAIVMQVYSILEALFLCKDNKT